MIGVGMILAAPGLGLLASAVVTLRATPEPGESVRQRIKRGVKAAKREFDEVVGESKESWGRVRNETGKAVKRTTTRIKEAVTVTK